MVKSIRTSVEKSPAFEKAEAVFRRQGGVLRTFGTARIVMQLDVGFGDAVIPVPETQFDFDGGMLASAVRETFARRGTAVPSEPVALTSAFAEDPVKGKQWQAFVRRSQLEHAPKDLVEVVRSLVGFLGPVVEAIAAGRRFEGSWKAPGPWTHREGA